MKCLLIVILLFSGISGFNQSGYKDSINAYLRNYVVNHEVVKGKDKERMQFFEVNEAYRVPAEFKPAAFTQWMTFKTSGPINKVYRLFGTLTFPLNEGTYHLNVYQSQDLMATEQYKNYLFLPFTDATSGNETYVSGRYIDLATTDIKNNQLILDFNKAYNPYCAYVSGVYNCPIPPKENALAVAIKAGEKAFKNGH